MAIDAPPLILDSFAWVEYFRGSRLGTEVAGHLESRRCVTPTIVLAELADKYAREGIRSLRLDIDEIESFTAIVPLDRAVAEAAGPTKAEMRQASPDVPLTDAIVYATAKVLRGEVLTGDPHFRGLPGVVFLA